MTLVQTSDTEYEIHMENFVEVSGFQFGISDTPDYYSFDSVEGTDRVGDFAVSGSNNNGMPHSKSPKSFISIIYCQYYSYMLAMQLMKVENSCKRPHRRKCDPKKGAITQFGNMGKYKHHTLLLLSH